MSRKKDLEKLVVEQQLEIISSIHAVKIIAEAYHKTLDAGLKSNIKQVEQEYNNKLQKVNIELDHVRNSSASTLQSLLNNNDSDIASWVNPSWINFTLPKTSSSPEFIRLGELTPDFLQTRLPAMPALLPLAGQKHVLVSSELSHSRTVAGILEALSWRIVTVSQPGTYQLTLIDPLDRGSNLASLLKLPESVRGRKIYCQDDEIENALVQLVADIEDIIQKRLLNTYPNVEAYNQANPNVRIPYRFMIFTGFPKGFSERASDMLFSIARSGKRAGVYLLGGVLKGEKIPHSFNFSVFMKLATYIIVKGSNQAEWNDPEFSTVPIRPDVTPPVMLIDRLVKLVNPLAAASASKVIPFKQIAVRKANWWQSSSANGLQATLGIDQSGALFQINIGRNAHHILLGGATGTGKTRLLHLLILMLTTTYSPSELELYLVDFKEGVEFQEYVTNSLPHARAIVLEAEREFGLSVLQRLAEEMEKRSQTFKAAGVSDLAQYRDKTKREMARILLVMDEYVVLFSEDDRIAIQANDALSALVMRGRSFGIHILLSAQRPASTFLSMNQIKSQMGLRIALKCNQPEDSTLILGDGNEKATRLAPVGEACITDEPTRIENTSQVRIAYVSPQDLTLYLRGIQEFAKLKQYSLKSPAIIFSRDAPAIWRKSKPVMQRLATSSWLPLPQPTTWLGQPMRIAEDISMSLERQNNANFLVLGSDEPLSMRILINCLFGLNLTCMPKSSRYIIVSVVDPGKMVGKIILEYKANSQQPIQIYARQEAVSTLDTLAKEMEDRLAQYPAKPKDTVFLIVAGLQHWTEVRGANSYTPSSAGEQLARLWQQGAGVGIHTLMWADRLDTIGNVAGNNVQGCLPAFGHRVALQMTSDESVNYLGVPDAGRLGGERAYYRNEQWAASELEKFKPYNLLKQNEIDEFSIISKERWGST